MEYQGKKVFTVGESNGQVEVNQITHEMSQELLNEESFLEQIKTS